MSLFAPLAANNRNDERAISPGILGATGLSRSVLADLFRHDGLFGADSALGDAEQAVVQARLGRVPGLPGRPVLAPTDARLLALAAYTDAVVARQGVARAQEAAQLKQAGFSPAAVSEVGQIVRNVRDVFGLRVQPRSDARLDTLSSSALAQAA